MYTDYEIMRGTSADYKLFNGIGLIDGLICPHFNEREEDFTSAFLNSGKETAYAIENNAAIVFIDGKATKCVSSDGRAYVIKNANGKIIKEQIDE